PRVERVVDVPVVDAGGSFVTEPGHHEASRIYYRPADGMTNVRPGSVELVYDVEEARDFLLTEFLGDFDFKDEASRANALGMALLPFVRDLIDGPTPLHVVDAPRPGCGKTYLVETTLYPGCGQVPILSEKRDD